jgi:hypothetical protein
MPKVACDMAETSEIQPQATVAEYNALRAEILILIQALYFPEAGLCRSRNARTEYCHPPTGLLQSARPGRFRFRKLNFDVLEVGQPTAVEPIVALPPKP